MKIWYVLRWGCQALLAELRNGWRRAKMIISNIFNLTAEDSRQWLEANPTAVSVDANNVQKSPLVIRSWSGEGSDKTAYPVYLTLQVESVAGTSTEVLYTYKSSSKVSEYTYTLPSDKYATANRITVSAYDDAARTKAVGSVQLNILADNPVPYPRSEEWSASLTYKNGEYLKVDDVLYMWTSRVPGNTTTDPKTWIQQNPTSKLWTEYPYNTLLAGQILLFDFAKIGQAIFKDQYMLSQHGVDADGNESDDYRNFGKIRYNPSTGESQNLFTPNLLFNFLTGAGHLARKNIEFWEDGSVKASSNITAQSLKLKVIKIGDKLSTGCFINNAGTYIADELKAGEVCIVRWALELATRLPAMVTITAQNSNVQLQDGTVINTHSELEFDILGTSGLIYGIGGGTSTKWIVFKMNVQQI